MSKTNAFDAVSIVTDEATERFSTSLIEDVDAKKRLRDACDMIDFFVEQTDAVAFDVDIDEKSMDITIAVICPEFTAEPGGERSIFFDLLSTAKSVTFSAADEEDCVSVGFRYGGIWSKA